MNLVESHKTIKREAAEDRVESAASRVAHYLWDNRFLPVTARNAALVICHIFMKFRGAKAHPNRPQTAMVCATAILETGHALFR